MSSTPKKFRHAVIVLLATTFALGNGAGCLLPEQCYAPDNSLQNEGEHYIDHQNRQIWRLKADPAHSGSSTPQACILEPVCVNDAEYAKKLNPLSNTERFNTLVSDYSSALFKNILYAPLNITTNFGGEYFWADDDQDYLCWEIDCDDQDASVGSDQLSAQGRPIRYPATAYSPVRYEQEPLCGVTITQCEDDTYCATGESCLNGICQQPSCNDKLQNGNETGIDCGGSCPSCTTTGPVDLSNGYSTANQLLSVPCGIPQSKTAFIDNHGKTYAAFAGPTQLEVYIDGVKTTPALPGTGNLMGMAVTYDGAIGLVRRAGTSWDFDYFTSIDGGSTYAYAGLVPSPSSNWYTAGNLQVLGATSDGGVIVKQELPATSCQSGSGDRGRVVKLLPNANPTVLVENCTLDSNSSLGEVAVSPSGDYVAFTLSSTSLYRVATAQPQQVELLVPSAYFVDEVAINDQGETLYLVHGNGGHDLHLWASPQTDTIIWHYSLGDSAGGIALSVNNHQQVAFTINDTITRQAMIFDPHTSQIAQLMQTSFDIMDVHINDKAEVVVSNVDITVGGEFGNPSPEQCYLNRFDPQ